MNRERIDVTYNLSSAAKVVSSIELPSRAPLLREENRRVQLMIATKRSARSWTPWAELYSVSLLSFLLVKTRLLHFFQVQLLKLRVVELQPLQISELELDVRACLQLSELLQEVDEVKVFGELLAAECEELLVVDAF